MVTDPISDMLTRIRNALMAGHSKLNIPSSGNLVKIAGILKDEGYINDYKLIKDHKQGVLKIYLKWVSDKPAITGLKRVSSPGKRVYSTAKDIPKVLRGFGIAIVSSNKGIITDHTARKENTGGEVLCYVW